MNHNVAIAVALASVLGVAAVVTGQGDRVTICHVPPGDPENAHTITVGAPGADAHMNHGDTNGACAGEAQNPKDDDSGSSDDQTTNPPPNQDQGPGEAAVPGATSSPIWLLLLVVAAIGAGTAVVMRQRQQGGRPR